MNSRDLRSGGAPPGATAASNATDVPNEVYDQLLPVLSDTALRLIHWLFRHTDGDGRESLLASLSQFQEAIRCSRPAIVAALRDLMALGIVARAPAGQGGFAYRVQSPGNWDWFAINSINDGRAEVSEHSRAIRQDPRWKALRQAVLERDQFTCHYCGARGADPVIDHVLPVRRGGTNALENLVTACKSCNRSKNTKTPEEWEQWLTERKRTQ